MLGESEIPFVLEANVLTLYDFGGKTKKYRKILNEQFDPITNRYRTDWESAKGIWELSNELIEGQKEKIRC